MVEHFTPPSNLFFLNPHHERNLSGKNMRLQDDDLTSLVIVMVVFAAFFVMPFVAILSRPFDPSRSAGFLGLIFVLSIIGYMLYLSVRRHRQNRRLERDGHLLVGYIVKAEGNRHRSGYRVEIHYRLTSPEGKALSGRENCSRPDMDANSLPADDTPVAVLYVSPDLFRVL